MDMAHLAGKPRFDQLDLRITQVLRSSEQDTRKDS
jgi:hypothetical protein